MGNDVYTYILLEGDKQQINHFINHHKYFENELEIYVWDCEKFLIEKKCQNFLQNKKDYFSTGGRFSQGKNSKNIDFISLESKYGFVEESIKELSKFYDKLTIKINYRDEDYEMGIGWVIIKNGELLGEDYISIHDLKNTHSIVNNITIKGDKNQKNNFIEEVKKTFSIKKINDDEIELKTNNEPYYYLFKEIQKKYSKLYLKLIYKDSLDRYYGYIIFDKGILINDNFIYLQINPKNGSIDYFKYRTLDEYLLKLNSV